MERVFFSFFRFGAPSIYHMFKVTHLNDRSLVLRFLCFQVPSLFITQYMEYTYKSIG